MLKLSSWRELYSTANVLFKVNNLAYVNLMLSHCVFNVKPFVPLSVQKIN
jgi:hypothetical protein